MTSAGAVQQAAAFVAGRTGARFRLVSEPGSAELRGTVIAAHAFAEEMNKTRRMAARLARGLAARGFRVVQRDLAGCGDSSGELREVSWADWREDVRAEFEAADPALPVWLFGVRAGALLAGAAFAQRPDANLLLWQPVVAGAQHLQQFLRLHAGARIVGASPSDAGATPAQRLKRGEVVEVGGYEMAPPLAAGLEAAVLDVPAGAPGRIVWCEVSADDPPSPSPAALRFAERVGARARPGVELHALHGPLFWQTQEIEDCDALLRCSMASVAGEPPHAAAAHG